MNKYEVLGVIGEGAYGVVLKCRNKETSELMAIKKFKEPDSNEKVQRITRREVKILRILKHENIVPLKEVIRRGGRLHLVFEYMERNVSELLQEKKEGLDEDTVRKLLYQLLLAIDFCHKNEIVHRDVKPDNILINSNGVLKLCDFDFAKQLSEERQNHTDYVATRWYRAPELLLQSDSYSKAVDIWGIGCVMGELIDGKPLFPGDNDLHQLCVIQKIVGPLSSELIEKYSAHPTFSGMQVMENWQPETLDKHFTGKVSALAIDLLKGLLDLDPEHRLMSEQALQHPYFASLKNPIDPKALPKSEVHTKVGSSTLLPITTNGTDPIENSLSSRRPTMKQIKLVMKSDKRDSLDSKQSKRIKEQLTLSLQNSKKNPLELEIDVRGNLSESPVNRRVIIKRSDWVLNTGSSKHSVVTPKNRIVSPASDVKLFSPTIGTAERKNSNGPENGDSDSLPQSPLEKKTEHLSRFHPGPRKLQLTTQKSKESLSHLQNHQKTAIKSPLKKPDYKDSPQRVSDFSLSLKGSLTRNDSNASIGFKPSENSNQIKHETDFEFSNQPLIQLPYLNSRYLEVKKKIIHNASDLRPHPPKIGTSCAKVESQSTMSPYRHSQFGSYSGIQNKFSSSHLMAQGTKIKI